MLLAVAKQYKGQTCSLWRPPVAFLMIVAHSYWAKDILFIVSDGHLGGMHAFLSAYHHVQTPDGWSCVFLSSRTLIPIPRQGFIEPLQNIDGGVVWTAICLDYPGHSFSELGIFYGMNLQLSSECTHQ